MLNVHAGTGNILHRSTALPSNGDGRATDIGRLACIGLQSRRALAAENLFLRKQLAGFRREKLKRGAPTIPRVESWQLQPKCSHGAIRSGM
jgi:hypothetical protein